MDVLLVGVLLLVILIGALILYKVLTEKDKMRYATVITNKRVFEVIDSTPRVVDAPDAEDLPTGSGLVEFEVQALDLITPGFDRCLGAA